MPLGYNTTPPTPSSKNTINSTTIEIRDFLLNKNLLPVYPYLSTTLNGSPRIGEPILDTMVGTGNISRPFGLPLETEGIFRMDIALLPNKFKNSSSTANNLVNVENIKSIPIDNTDWPNGLQEYRASDISKYGIEAKTIEREYRKKATIKNLYIDETKQVDGADWISLQTAPISQQVTGYLDTYGGINLGNVGGIQASNIIGSVLNGQGLGFSKGGVIPNFDIRSSLAGRILGATGIINDTKLGMVGGQQLALALANNAGFNITQAALGALNVQDNVLSLVKNGTLAGFRPNYQITVPSGDSGKVLDYTARILGFTLPKSYLEDAGSIFQSDNISENIDRANAMLRNTGKGQFVSLIKNINANINGISPNGYDNPSYTNFRTGYAPGYENNDGEKQINGNQLYAFSKDGNFIDLLGSCDGIIPDFSFDREKKVNDSGFKDFASEFLEGYSESNIKNKTFSWGTTEGGLVNSNSEYTPFVGEKKNLLSKTQKLFNSKGMKNIISSKGDMKDIQVSQIQTAVVGGGISHGNPVLNSAAFNSQGILTNSFKTAEETYCRSWTTSDRYDKVSKLVRSRGLDEMVGSDGKKIFRSNHFNPSDSVLDKYGFAKIAPYRGDTNDIKKYMFSIENLAWADNTPNLLPIETGPGDLISGVKGRIMWFPPYDIKFNENTSVSWESNNFIGRGESVYTYNNTERAGTLSFKVIVDHPSYVNTFRGSEGPDDHYIASFFAGCVELDPKFTDRLTANEKSVISTLLEANPEIKHDKPQVEPCPPFNVYFPNDVYDFNPLYENGLQNPTTTPINYPGNGEGFGINISVGQVTHEGMNYIDNFNYGLNSGNILGLGVPIEIVDSPIKYSGFSDKDNLLPALNDYLLTKCPNCDVLIEGYASQQGKADKNIELSQKRADGLAVLLRKELFKGMDASVVEKKIKAIGRGVPDDDMCVAGDGKPTDTKACKVSRKATVTFIYNSQSEPKKKENENSPVVKQAIKSISNIVRNRFYNETNYFEQLTDVDSFVFDKFRDKIKYFHPGFHSTTPEGLNSRLTFLNQCTRQGSTKEVQGTTNLAFGRAPVCILRIGDFYNTKIIIDNLSINYEPIVWDLNPEGIGVQPMIANVDISFKFIGGSTLTGPINKLQNALSFNYYANTQVYDARADYIVKDDDSNKKTKNGKEIPPYSIVNGNPNQNDAEIISQTEVINNEPTLDQIKAADGVNYITPIQPLSTPLEQDNANEIRLEVIGDLTKTTIRTSPTKLYNLTGNVTFKTILSDNLSQQCKAKISIFDIDNKSYELVVFDISTGDTIVSKTIEVKPFPNTFMNTNLTTNVVEVDVLNLDLNPEYTPSPLAGQFLVNIEVPPVTFKFSDKTTPSKYKIKLEINGIEFNKIIYSEITF